MAQAHEEIAVSGVSQGGVMSASDATWLTPDVIRRVALSVGTPVFVYSEAQLRENAHRILSAAQASGLGSRIRPYIPFFPNSNPHLFSILQSVGMGALVQMPSEHRVLARQGVRDFIASTGYLSNAEVAEWLEFGCPLFLSSLDEIEYVIDRHPDVPIFARLDSLSSGKPGVKYGQLAELRSLLDRKNRGLEGFELYCGSSHSPQEMVGFLEQVFMIYRTYFPEAKTIDLAGGYGFDYEELDRDRKHFDWDLYLRQLAEAAARYDVPDSVDFMIEPARDLLADVGVLLLSVTRDPVLQPGSNQLVSDGSRMLMPSAKMKNRQHNVLFIGSDGSELAAGNRRAVLRGRGILRHEQILPAEVSIPDQIGEGDRLLILDVGAYCATQHMEFLNMPGAAEVLIDEDSEIGVLTNHGGEEDKWRHLNDKVERVASR